MDVGRSRVRNVAAVARMAGHLLTGPLLRPYRSTWGATPEEVATAWPGDELLPDASWTVTHAVTVWTGPEEVWPWLAQLSQGRGGLYSFERLENLIGCRMAYTDRVLAVHRDPVAAGQIRLHPQAALPVARVEPDRDLVLATDPGPAAQQRVAGGLWSFHLRPAPGGTTRLVERLSFRAGSTWPERVFISPALIEPISFVMSQEMLRNIAALAETAHCTRKGITMTGKRTSKKARRWSDLSPGEQTAVLTLASLQVSLAVTAWTDLAFRPAGQVNGRKAVWAAVIAVNFVGPALYFTRGIRR